PETVRTAKFELVLEVRESAQGLAFDWLYCTDLFEAATIARMACHFERLLDAVIANPAADVWTLPLLDAAERRQILVEWNATQAPLPAGESIHALFEAQAQRTPEAIAVRLGDCSVSYCALDRHANRLAHQLVELGAGPGSIVGIYAERSPDAIASMLAVLKTGAAYLPLDPTYPDARIRYM